MNISVVIPLLNEEESLNELYDWIAGVMRSNHFSYEIIFIDDGSTDGSWKIITDLSKMHAEVRAIRFAKNYGKSQALHIGFAKAQGDVVVTMDADLQDNPEEIPEFYRMVTDENYDLVSGWKKKRYDSVIAKNLPSKLFNWAARKTSGLRYIPVLVKNEGFINIGERIVQHQARKYGKTKFGMERFIHGFLDLITIWFVSRFGKRPMHFFGALGAIMLIIGFAFAIYLGIDKLILNPTGRLLTQRPQFYISLVTMIIGSQFFVAGFIGEIILRSRQDKKRYTVKDELNL
jgi:hypothetical protein